MFATRLTGISHPTSGHFSHCFQEPNFTFASLAGIVWACQFACQKIGEPAMGSMAYISFAVVMGSCVLFSSLLGVVLGEWKGTGAKTKAALAAGLLVLAASIGITVIAKSL